MRFRALGVAGTVALAMAIPGAALAGATPSSSAPSGLLPTTTTTPTTTAPAPAPVPSVAAGRARLTFSGLTRVRSAPVSVSGLAVSVHGVVTPWRAGQRVLVQGIESGRVFSQKLVTLKPSSRRVYGSFSVRLVAPRAGLVAVRLKHSASSTLSAFGAERHYQVLSASVHLGSRGPFVELLQSRLAALHLYIPQTGVFDAGTQLALDTYHRLLGDGEGHTGVDPATVADLLAGRGAFHARFPGQGVHAEGDLSDQVLAYLNGATVQYLLPISSGKPSTPTVLGSYRVYRKQPEYTSDGMYFSNFFTGGYAIHGYDPAPDYPASHGCMRIPIADAIFAYGLLDIGDWVDTYYT